MERREPSRFGRGATDQIEMRIEGTVVSKGTQEFLDTAEYGRGYDAPHPPAVEAEDVAVFTKTLEFPILEVVP